MMRRTVVLLLVVGMLGAWLRLGQIASAQSVSPPDAAGVFPSLVHQGDITEFLKLMSAATKRNIIPSKQVRGAVTVNLYNVTFDEALDVVLSSNGYAWEEKGAFIFVYTEKEYEELTARNRKMESRVFRINYIPAKDVEELISPLLSDDAKVTTSPEAGSATSEGGEQWASNNYIIVLDYVEQLEQVAELIEQMDHRPAQVLIEATILVADVSDDNEFGVDFNVLGGLDFTSASSGTGLVAKADTSGATPGDGSFSGTELDIKTGGDGLSIGIFKSSLSLAIDALESITDVVTIGNPKILTLNRQQGQVLVGNRDGYITTQVSQTTSTQTVKFLETGIHLTFRPFVMDDGYIRMELETKDSDGGVVTAGGFTLPSETTASVTSNVLVKDGHTIIIGGLFRDKTTIKRSQVPLLGNFPVIGQVFGSTKDSVKKEEVIFMITPHIVEESIDYAQAEIAMENINTLRLGVRDGLMFQGRTSLASANYQTAREEEEAGDFKDALWHATMATQCNPTFLDAIQLREDLLNRRLYKEEYGSMEHMMRRVLESESAADASKAGWTENDVEVSQAVGINKFVVEGPVEVQVLDVGDVSAEPLNVAWDDVVAPVTVAADGEATQNENSREENTATDAWTDQESGSAESSDVESNDAEWADEQAQSSDSSNADDSDAGIAQDADAANEKSRDSEAGEDVMESEPVEDD